MANEYRLLSYTASSGQPAAGDLIGEMVYEAAKLLGVAGDVRDSSSVLGLLQAWDTVHPQLHAAAAKADPKACR